MTQMTVDDALLVHCGMCDRVFEPTRKTLMEIVGWTVRARSGGGTNHINFRRETGRVMCAQCERRMRETGNAMQGQML